MGEGDQSGGTPVEERLATSAPPGRLRICGLMLSAGVLAGLAGWQSVERLSAVFQLPQELADVSPTAEGEIAQRVEAANREISLKNRTLALAALGGFGGVFFAVAAALASPRRRLALALVLGIVLGVGCGAASAAAGQFAGEGFDTIPHQRETPQELSMWGSYRGMAVHVATLAVLGLGYGIVAGVGFRRRVVAAALAAVGAAVVWGALFPFLGAILFPTGSPELEIPDGTNLRILWTLGASVIIAIALCRVGIRTGASDAGESGDPAASNR